MITKKNCIVYLKSTNVAIFEMLLNVVRDILDIIIIKWTPEGIILTNENDSICLLNVFLKKEKLEDYHCKENLLIEVNVNGLYQEVLKRAYQDEIIIAIENTDLNFLKVT